MRISLIGALVLAGIATASVSHAAHERETKLLPTPSEGASPGSCVWVPYDTPPEELAALNQAGARICMKYPGGGGGFGAIRPGPYQYPPNRIGHEEEIDFCRPAGKCTGVLCRPSFEPAVKPEPWEVSFSYGKTYGGQLFGAGFLTRAYVEASPGSEGDGEQEASGDRIAAGAFLNAGATAFGTTLEVVDIRAEAEAVYGDVASAETRVFIAGLVDHHESGQVELDPEFDASGPLFSVSAPFSIGPVTITVTAGVQGEIGLHGKVGPAVEVAGTGLKVEGEPYARLSAYGEVGAYLVPGLVGAGVEGELTLVRAEVPTTGKLLFDNTTADVRWSLDSDLELGSIDGSLNVWAKFLARFEVELAKWEGVQTTIPLFHLRNCRTSFGG